jgi:hypothetical protein
VATSIGKYSSLLFELILLAILILWPQGLGAGVFEGAEKIADLVRNLGKPRRPAPSEVKS